jgi:hypothetical protein
MSYRIDNNCWFYFEVLIGICWLRWGNVKKDGRVESIKKVNIKKREKVIYNLIIELVNKK